MLILTPTPLQTAAERALFAELSGWETGSGVRGGVMASLPVVEGPMQRRQADALLFVPEGLAVVRVVEVDRQSGVVTANPDGAWTIGPDGGPGDVLQLAGGGSTPLEGLMRAGMHAAVTLRKAGLEPGKIARLTILTGAVTGLVPADGDLGEGDQVALVEAGSLLLGISRAARYAGSDNPRLWTTADVRAAVEALGVAGRSPSVEELNVEGFAYSPYVLRRQELLTPAALNAAPTRTTVLPPAGMPSTNARPLPPGGPLVDPAAAARVAAAAVQAQEEAERTPSAAPEPAAARHPAPSEAGPQAVQPYEPTLPVALPPARSGDTLAAIGGYAAPAEPGMPGHRSAAEDTGGLGGLFGGGTTEVAAAPQRELPPELRPRARVDAPPPPRTSTATVAGPDGSPRGRRGLWIAAALVLVVVLVGVGIWAVTRDTGDPGTGGAGATTSTAAAPSSSAGLAVGATEVVNGTTFTLRAFQLDSTCQGHAYSAVADFFARSDCTSLSRSLWSADAGGQPAVVALSQVTMPDAGSAQALKALADTDGSGNVSDLLREGVRYAGGPTKLSNAQYASAPPQGTTVMIAETSWTGTAGASSALDALASGALSLPAVG